MSPTSCQTAPPRISRGRILQIWQFDYNPNLPKFRGTVRQPTGPLRFACQQPLHGHLPVTGIPGIPVRHAAIGRDSQVIEALVQVADGLDLPVAPRQRRPVRQGPRSIVPEHDLSGSCLFAAEATLVYQAVVVATELHEVVQARLAALAPVLDVMGIDETLASAARKAASVVSQA